MRDWVLGSRFSGAVVDARGFAHPELASLPENPSPKTQNPSDGFSLVEVLVALFITAILTALGTSLVLGSLSGKERLEAAVDGARGLELAHATLMADLAQLAARPVREPDGDRRPWVLAGEERSYDTPLLGFARAGWDNPGGAEPRGSIVYVEYVHEGDRLIRRSWTRADPTMDTPMVERVLLEGVEEARVRFGDGLVWTPGFISRPGEEKLFPPLIELDLEIAGLGQVRQVFATGHTR